jgi:hypothetical protein
MRPSRKDTRKAGQDVAGTNLSQPWVELEEKECSCWFHWRMPDVFECGPVMLDPDSWGPGKPNKVISCNNNTFLVNDSLASALEGLRQMQADVHIWCDTSCINQSDPVEKAQQVRNMLRISRRPSTLLHGLEVPIGGPSTSSTP